MDSSISGATLMECRYSVIGLKGSRQDRVDFHPTVIRCVSSLT